MKVKNLKELKKYIEKSIDDSLQNEVFEAVKETQLEHIQENVLSVYSPNYYIRREDSGIDDSENIICSHVKNGVLKVENITQFNPEYETENHGLGLVKLIEYGHRVSGYFYDYPGDPKYTKSRPFIANTKKEIGETKSHVTAIKIGLKRNKIKTG